MNTTERPTELAAVPGSALADLCASLSEQKDRYDGYKLQSERSGNIGWAARYGDIADAYEHCIDRIEALMSKPNKTGGAPADLVNLTATGASKMGDAAPCVAFDGRSRGDDGRGYDRPPNVTGDIAGTIDTVKPPNVAGSFGVRRLTPVECERLQGFPDNWTKIPQPLLKKLNVQPEPDNPKHWVPDSPRYAAIGNSMAVPVMGWIARRIEFVKSNF